MLKTLNISKLNKMMEAKIKYIIKIGNKKFTEINQMKMMVMINKVKNILKQMYQVSLKIYLIDMHQ